MNSEFSKDIDKWFDIISSVEISNKQEILFIINKTANKKNFTKLLDLIYNRIKNNNGTGLRSVYSMIISIADNNYKNEFLNRFSNNKKQVSVCSEFFSLLKQALTYKDILTDIENHNRNINF
jgi:hypothetical protein